MRVGALAVLAACGRANFDSRACSPWTAATRFTDPVAVTELNDGNVQQQPHVSPDRRTIYFSRTVSVTGFDIFTADRIDPDVPFGDVHRLDEASSMQNETAFAPTIDQLTAYVSSSRGGDTDLWTATRAQPSDPWGAPVRLAISTLFVDYDPFPSADGLRLYWMIPDWDQGVGGTDIVVAARASPQDAFGPPAIVGEIDTAANEDNPSETADGRMIVFASNRAGGTLMEPYFATRDSIDEAFGAPMPVPVGNPALQNTETGVTWDGCELWLVVTENGLQHIYVTDVLR